MGVIYLITNRVNKQINNRVTKQAWQNQLRQFRSFEETERETQVNVYIPPRVLSSWWTPVRYTGFPKNMYLHFYIL